MSTIAYLPITTPTPCPTWCDYAGAGHPPLPRGVETVHQRAVPLWDDERALVVEAWANGELVGQPPTLAVNVQFADVTPEDAEQLAAVLLRAAEQLRQARASD